MDEATTYTYAKSVYQGLENTQMPHTEVPTMAEQTVVAD